MLRLPSPKGWEESIARLIVAGSGWWWTRFEELKNLPAEFRGLIPRDNAQQVGRHAAYFLVRTCSRSRFPHIMFLLIISEMASPPFV